MANAIHVPSIGLEVLVIVPAQRASMIEAIAGSGCRCRTVPSVASGVRSLGLNTLDVVVVELSEVRAAAAAIQVLRKATPLPVLAALTDAEEADVAALLAVGAEDVLVTRRPIELVARLWAARERRLRVVAAPPLAEVEPDLHIDRTSRTVESRSRRTVLTRTEMRLLLRLVAGAGTTVTHEELLACVWETNLLTRAHYVRVYVSRLRQKIEADPTTPRWILSVPGEGYRWTATTAWARAHDERTP